MSDSKSGSKNDLNESNMPLLDDEQKAAEAGEKEKIELTEKDDSKDTEKKVKKVKVPRGPNCIDRKSVNLNLADRDGQSINTEIDIGFDDVLAEPYNAHGFEGVWKLAFVLFSEVKGWFYKLFAAILAIPAALIWAVVFSLVSVLYIWIGAPLLRLFDFGIFLVRRVWTAVLSATLEPVAEAVSVVFRPKPVTETRRIVISNRNASQEALEDSVKKMLAEV